MEEVKSTTWKEGPVTDKWGARVLSHTWKCPECGSAEIEMVSISAIVNTEVHGLAVYGDDIDISFGNNEVVEAEAPYRFCCKECGHTIAEGTDDDFVEAFMRYLVEQAK